MLKDFKEFVARGNVFDLAVGLVIGGAFATVVKSFVDDILMPPLGFISGGTDFSELYINLSSADYDSLAQAQEAGAATINYGRFLNNVIAFLIVAFAVFSSSAATTASARAWNPSPPRPATASAPSAASPSRSPPPAAPTAPHS